MLQIDVEFIGAEFRFRTNENGANLFIGVGENRQISCESGFDSLSRIKRAIKEHLRSAWVSHYAYHDEQPMPRVKYKPLPNDSWRP